MIVHPDVEQYLNQFAPLPHPVLAEMAEYAKTRDFPIVGPLVGRLLYLLIEYGHVHTILECGSGFGYSALWMALALPENGNITCIEYDAENIDRAKNYFDQAGMLHKVTFLKGNALDIVPTLSGTYDFIMNDVEKSQYPELLPLLISRLRVGGLLVTDNVLWKGEVVSENREGNAAYVHQYNQMLYQEQSLFTTIIPLRDGLSLSIKFQR
ncbi:MAG: O-methyltransferase [Calditrichaeota bacterium]|nr:O-methyltransferase [Calditrichota bacterium]